MSMPGWTIEDVRRHQAKMQQPQSGPEIVVSTPKAGRHQSTPTKTEMTYKIQVLDRQQADGILTFVGYESVTFKMSNGHRYTPDWVCWDKTGKMICIEVKGSYRMGSYQRARLAFDQARVEWPTIVWIWAERQKDGGWK